MRCVGEWVLREVVQSKISMNVWDSRNFLCVPLAWHAGRFGLALG